MVVDGEMNTTADMLTTQLLSIPFPYKDILIKQISTSVISSVESDGYFCITFCCPHVSMPFPAWLPLRPLVWQISTDDAPILGQLFQRNGFIEKYEIIDMGFKEIKWDYIWTTTPQLDVEYDINQALQILMDKDITIHKMAHRHNSVSLEITAGKDSVVFNFWNCSFQQLSLGRDPIVTSINIRMTDIAPQFHVFSSDGSISFYCEAMYLQYHSHI